MIEKDPKNPRLTINDGVMVSIIEGDSVIEQTEEFVEDNAQDIRPSDLDLIGHNGFSRRTKINGEFGPDDGDMLG